MCPFERFCFPLREKELSFSGDNLPVFTEKIKMFTYLRYGGYGPEVMKDLKSFDLGNISEFDLNKILQQKSQYLHGFSLFYQKNLKKSSNTDQFATLMNEDMEKYYEKKNNEGKVQYLFKDIRRNHLKKISHQIYLENQVYDELKKIEINDENDVVDQILNKFPNYLTINDYNENLRREHLKWIVKAKKQNTFPFS